MSDDFNPMPATFADLALADRVSLQIHPIQDRESPNWEVEAVTAPDRVFGATKPRIQVTVAGIGTKAAKRQVSVAINNRVSQSVPHLHVHVVPRRKGDGLKGFFWPRSKYGSEEEARDAAEAIRSALAEK